MNPVLNPHVFLGPFATAYPEIVVGAQSKANVCPRPRLLSLWAGTETNMQPRTLCHTVDFSEAGKRVAEASDAYWVAKYACQHEPAMDKNGTMSRLVHAVEADLLNPMSETQVGAWRNLVSLIYSAKTLIASN